MPALATLWWLLKQPYERLIRPRLPRTIAVNNGVAILSGHLFDSLLPWHSLHLPDYEGPLLEGIRSEVIDGDDVVVVGGGWGVATVAAARQVGPSGRVVTYEGSARQVDRIRETLQLNVPGAPIELNHAIVGPAYDVYGGGEAGEQLVPEDLPVADVLVMDCEGAELAILEGMAYRPREVVVETHGLFGSSPDQIRRLLEGKSYEVEDLGPAAPEKVEFCEQNGIRVLLARSPG